MEILGPGTTRLETERLECSLCVSFPNRSAWAIGNTGAERWFISAGSAGKIRLEQTDNIRRCLKEFVAVLTGARSRVGHLSRSCSIETGIQPPVTKQRSLSQKRASVSAKH